MESYYGETFPPTKLYFQKLTWKDLDVLKDKKILFKPRKSLFKKIPIRSYISSLKDGKVIVECITLS